LQSMHEMVVEGGRLLTVEVSGAQHGAPVFLLHGTPGSRRGPKPRDRVLYNMGVQLISYDRPGYGRSTRVPGRRVADAARDIEIIADRLDLNRFSVVGRSGGGPHALACAALLPQRVHRVAVLVGLAPRGAIDLDWYEGMGEDNVRKHASAADDVVSLVAEISERAERVSADPHLLIEILRAEMSGPDLRFTRSSLYRGLLSQSYQEALREGPSGWIDDVLAFRYEWGFAVEHITGPVLLWHGAEDTFSPVHHSRWLADRIPGALVHVQPDAAHFAAVEVLPLILPWLTE
jgi:pimeloyl-ACP methyl ester carboxylesterase